MAEDDTPAAPQPMPRLQNQPSIEPNRDPHLQPMQDDRPHS
jgi:sec-independent protein translocase protein TatA